MVDTPHRPVILASPVVERPTAWTFQRRVLGALVLRDMLAEGATRRLGYMWLFLQQVMVIACLLLLFTIRGKTGSPLVPIPVFVCTGYPIWRGFTSMWEKVASACVGGGPMLMFPQITLLDVVLSKIMLEFTIHTVSAVLIGFGICVILGTEVPADPLSVMMAYWAALLLGVGVGFVSGSIRRYFPHFEDLISPIRRLGLFLSGVILLGAEIPYSVQPYLFWNPIFKCIEISRQSWHPAYQSPIFKPWDVVYCIIVILAVGLFLERVTRRSSTI